MWSMSLSRGTGMAEATETRYVETGDSVQDFMIVLHENTPPVIDRNEIYTIMQNHTARDHIEAVAFRTWIALKQKKEVVTRYNGWNISLPDHYNEMMYCSAYGQDTRHIVILVTNPNEDRASNYINTFETTISDEVCWEVIDLNRTKTSNGRIKWIIAERTEVDTRMKEALKKIYGMVF
ncbi:hypothetical protein CHS0354_035484 [Potamilus streckersoni]|uniref:Uncharacterized protein n=1 Tax=Potamilus streckersoni TaxID=2493646 RepID=A0AAE0VKQ7_9BIVA|nr:hypothetical protein CHS0354_035484 [Potamilus streckersoni]